MFTYGANHDFYQYDCTEPVVKPEIPLAAALEAALAGGVVTGWLSPATGARGSARTSWRFASFPKVRVGGCRVLCASCSPFCF